MSNKPTAYIFFTEERTLELCKYSFRKLGFQKIVVIDGDDSFKEKYVRCAQHALSTDEDFFVRSDADCVVFEGLLRLIEEYDANNPSWIEGKYYDYFMNRFRGGTPHILPRKAFEILASNPDHMPNSKKPESDFSRFLKGSKLVNFVHANILTNLHDFEQYPGKVCNTFLNRLKRGHKHLYDTKYLYDNMPVHYLHALKKASDIFDSKNYDNINSMDFSDFSDMDRGFPPIDESRIADIYNDLENLYTSLVGLCK
jgi:hypothetical protein